MTFDVYDVIIAAWLHDIGKAVQRAEEKITDDYSYTYCPTYNNRQSHIHTAHGDDFLRKNSLDYSQFSDANNNSWDAIVSLAASHHKPQTFSGDRRLADLLVMADEISAGLDRGNNEDDIKDGKQAKIRYKAIGLHPIFNRVTYDKPFSTSFRYPLESIDDFFNELIDEKYTLPKRDDSSLVVDYKTLLEKFAADFKNLQAGAKNLSRFQYVLCLESLTREYFWCVPSATNQNYPSISLYHHLKTTAIIAAALFMGYWEDQSITFTNKDQFNNKDFLLICGDLSGIQSYLFDLNPEHAAKASKILRARSFKIQLLAKMAKQFLYDKTGLTPSAELIDAGGKFILLAPNTQKIKDTLKEILCIIETECLKHFQGHLGLNIDYGTPVSISDLQQDNFRKTLKESINAVEQHKKYKYKEVLQSAGKWEEQKFVFNADKMYHSNQCTLCGRRASKKTKYGEELCQFCYDEIELGRILSKDNLTIVFDRKNGFSLDNISQRVIDKPINPEAGKIYFQTKKSASIFPVMPLASYIPKWKDEYSQKISLAEIKAKDEEFDEYLPLPLDVLAKIGANSAIEYLGVIKGDVDGLGEIFRKNLVEKAEKPELLALASYISLSEMMDIFFSRYIPKLIQNKYDMLYIVYAGGDDFVILGPWAQAIEFVSHAQKAFTTFVANNPEVHFSCGVCLTTASEPVKYGVNLAEELLEKAKTENRLQKNSISIFGRTVTWELFHKLREEEKELFSQFDEQDPKKLSKQLLYKLLEFSDRKNKIDKDKTDCSMQDYLYLSHLYYSLRNVNDELKEQITDYEKDGDIFANLRIPLSCVIYSNRK